MNVRPKTFVLLVVMSIVGLTSAIVVLYEGWILRTPPPLCIEPGQSIFNIPINCEKVIFSPYGEIYGIPLELLAAGWFIINISLVSVVSFAKESISRKTLKFLFGWRFIGVAIIPYFLYLEFFVIKSICIYCTIMHIMIIIDFIVISYFLFSKHAKLYKNATRT